MFVEPITYLGGDECRPQFFQRLGIHPGRCKAGGETKRAAGVIGVAGHGDAYIGIADITLADRQSLVGQIEAPDHADPIENERLASAWRVEHGAAAGNLERPATLRLRGRLGLSEQRKAIIACQNLERDCKHAARGIPIDLEFRAINREATVAAVAVTDKAAIGNDTADQTLGHAIWPDLAAQARRYRQIDFERAVAET